MDSCTTHRFCLTAVCAGLLLAVTSSPASACSGDVNADSVVDALDLGAVLSRLGCDPSSGDTDCAQADANDDGFVDPLDAGFVMSRFGDCPAELIFGNPLYDVGREPMDVVLSDLDGDGKLDLVVANQLDSTVSVLIGEGGGFFSPRTDYPTGGRPVRLAVSDLNGDGLFDVVTVNNIETSVSVLLNLGEGVLAEPINDVLTHEALALVVADFNNDGKPDAAVTASRESDGILTILVNTGNGVLVADASHYGGLPSQSVLAEDIDQDGDVDLVLGSETGTNAHVYYNSGGDFADPIDFDTNLLIQTLTLVDLDDDGDLDLIAGKNDNDSAENLSVLFNEGGVFGTEVLLHSAGELIDFSSGDFDGDGDIDLVALSADEIVQVLLNDGAGLLIPGKSWYTNGQPTGMDIGDVNDDGRLDIAVSGIDSKNVILLLGGDQATIEGPSEYPAGDLTAYWSVGDLDADGDDDLVASSLYDPSIRVMMNYGNRQIATTYVYPFGTWPTSTALADFDGDLDLDMAAADYGDEGTPGIGVFLNEGQGEFASPEIYLSANYPFFIRAGDLNNDESPDIAVGCTWGVGIYFNQGDGQFGAQQLLNVIDGAYYISLGDVNADGDLDIVSASGRNNYVLRFNNGFGEFTTVVSDAIPDSVSCADLADIDSDCDLDLIAALDESVLILFNDGYGVFTIESSLATPVYPYIASVADLDFDGIPDLTVAGADNSDEKGQLRFFPGLGGGAFDAAMDFGIGQGGGSPVASDFDNDGDPDLLIMQWGNPVDQVGTILWNRVIPNLTNTCVEQSDDCNANGLADSCEIYAPSLFPSLPASNATGLPDYYFVGSPDNRADGISYGQFTYDLSGLYVHDGPGSDFNVYSEDDGSTAFDDLNVLVSIDGLIFRRVTGSEQPLVRIPGDEAHENPDAARSYDLSGSGMGYVAYIRIQAASGPRWAGFPLDAVGLIHAGSAPDCNYNRSPDSCDIAEGTSSDEDADGVPDECG